MDRSLVGSESWLGVWVGGPEAVPDHALRADHVSHAWAGLGHTGRGDFTLFFCFVLFYSDLFSFEKYDYLDPFCMRSHGTYPVDREPRRGVYNGSSTLVPDEYP